VESPRMAVKCEPGCERLVSGACPLSTSRVAVPGQKQAEALINGSIPLKGAWPKEERILANSLWSERTCVIFVVRRLGCPLCREHAANLLAMQDEFNEHGADIVLVSAQDVGVDIIAAGKFVTQAQRQAMQEATNDSTKQRLNSGLQVYTDSKNAFHRALGGRRVKHAMLLQPSVLLRSVVNAYKHGARFDDINDQSSYLGGTVIVHPVLGVVHLSPETQDFALQKPDQLLDIVKRIPHMTEADSLAVAKPSLSVGISGVRAEFEAIGIPTDLVVEVP